MACAPRARSSALGRCISILLALGDVRRYPPEQKRREQTVKSQNKQMKWQRYNVLITFYPPEDGGRRVPPQPPFSIDRSYRPHIVVDGDSDYLGVRFVGGSETKPGEPGRFSFVEQFPDVDYSSLAAGVKFTIREGSNIVGNGVILERVMNVRDNLGHDENRFENCG